MKRNVLLIFMSAVLMWSCSNDDGGESEIDESEIVENDIVENDIVGTWSLVQIELDDDQESDNAILIGLILDFLNENNCNVVTFTFNEDLTLVFENSASSIVPSDIITGGFSCPVESETLTSVYAYDGETLTTGDGDGVSLAINAVVTGDELIVDTMNLDIPNFNVEGSYIFARQ